MANDKLIQLCVRRLDRFQNCLSETINYQENKNIHQLRIAIKRIRIMACLLKVVSDQDDGLSDYLRLYSKLFRKAGMVREIRINIKLIKKFDPICLKPYLDYQTKVLQQAGKKLDIEVRSFNNEEYSVRRNLLLQRFEGIVQKDLANTASERIVFLMKKVMKLKDRPHKNLHKIRIKLNRVVELLNIQNELYPSAEYTNMLGDIDLMCKRIGVWHNYEILINSLSQFVKQLPEKTDTGGLKKEIKKIKKVARKKRIKMGKQLKSYFKKENIDRIGFFIRQ